MHNFISLFVVFQSCLVEALAWCPADTTIQMKNRIQAAWQTFPTEKTLSSKLLHVCVGTQS